MSNARRMLLTGFVIGWFAASASAADAKNPLAGWIFRNGPEFPGAVGEMRWNDREGRDKPGCIEVRFSFEKGGNYVSATTVVNDPGNTVRRARLWIKKPGRNRVTLRIADAAEQSFQKPLDYTWPEWQQIEVDLSTWQSHWGGPNDGKVRWPVRTVSVLYENSGDVRQGSYLVDDVEFLPASSEPPPVTQVETTYPVARFGPDERWRAQGPAGCRLDRGEWTYQLQPSAPRNLLLSDLPIYGDPRRLRLRVVSDGSGHELTIGIGAHFQAFERSLGTLDTVGEMAFEVPTDTLRDWRHSGGPNDGVRQLPLRFCRLSLIRKSDRERGTIRLLALEADATIAPAQSVVIVPDARLLGDTAHFDVVLRNLLPHPVPGMLRAEVRDVEGRLSVEEARLRLPPGAEPVRQTFSATMNGGHFREMAFRFITATLRTPEASVTVTDAPPVPTNTAAVNPIGVGVYLYRFQGNPEGGKRMRELAALAQRAGVRWSREEFQWHAIEPQRGQFRWEYYNDLVRIAGEHGIHVYAILAYWSAWATNDGLAYTEQGVHEYARWAAEVVRRYKDRIKHWEIWNEPNIFFWSGPKDLYIAALKEAYAAIKSEDPEAHVLGCSTAGIDTKFIDKVMAGGGPFDILTIHPYRATLDECGFLDELRRTHEQVNRRPVWITEMGWPTKMGGVSEREQAALVARTYLSALASGVVGSISWYDFRDDGDNPAYNEHRFGLLRSDMRPKAGYRALATIGRVLGRHKAAGPATCDGGLVQCAFADGAGGNDVVAVWSPGEDRAVQLTPDAKAARAIDTMGQPVRLDAQGRFAGLLPAGLPVYFIGTGIRSVAAGEIAKIAVEPPFARPGDEVRIRVESRPDGAGAPTWQWPVGWKAGRAANADEWVVRVPNDEPQGSAQILADFQAAGRRVRVPVSVRVQPAMLWL